MAFIDDLRADLREATGLEARDLTRGAIAGVGRVLQGDDRDPSQIVVIDREERRPRTDWAPMALAAAAVVGLVLLVRK
jgi:hypothetical protein